MGFFDGNIGGGFGQGNIFPEGSGADRWAEGVSRALGGGLVNPTDGTAAVTDPGGDFFREGGDGESYDGPTWAFDAVARGGGEAAERGTDAATNALGGLPLKWKAALALAALAVLTQVFRPLLGLAENATED